MRNVGGTTFVCISVGSGAVRRVAKNAAVTCVTCVCHVECRRIHGTLATVTDIRCNYMEQDRQCTYKVTLRRVRATIVAVRKR